MILQKREFLGILFKQSELNGGIVGAKGTLGSQRGRIEGDKKGAALRHKGESFQFPLRLLCNQMTYAYSHPYYETVLDTLESTCLRMGAMA